MRRETFDTIFPRFTGKNYIKGPMIAADHLAFLLHQPISQVCQSGELLAKGLLYAQKLYDSDFIVIFSDVSVEAEALGVELDYFPHRNPHPVRHLSMAEIEVKKMWKLGRLPELFKAGEICRRRLGDDFTIFFSMKDAFSLTAMTVGMEDFLIALIDDTKEASDALNRCCKAQIGLLTHIIENGYIPFIGSPIASGGLIGARYFSQFAAPGIECLFHRAHSINAFAALHICGSITEIFEPLAKLQPDILSFEDAKILPYLSQMPDTICMGYIPTSSFLGENSTAAFKSAQDCAANLPRPYILSSGCDLPAGANPLIVKIAFSA